MLIILRFANFWLGVQFPLKEIKTSSSKRDKLYKTTPIQSHFLVNPPKVSKGPFILHRNCVAVAIYRFLSAAGHRSFTAFQVKMNLTFMRHCSAVPSQFLCRRVQCGNATQLRCSMNGPLKWSKRVRPSFGPVEAFSFFLRGNCTLNWNWACFVCYLKVINTFFEK